MSINSFQRIFKGPIAWFLVVLIAISFSFFGTQGALNILGDSSDFKVGGADAVVPYLFAFNSLQANIEEQNFSEEEKELYLVQIQASAIKYAIEQILISNFVAEQGMYVSEKAIFKTLAMAYLQEVGGTNEVTKQDVLSFLSTRTSVEGTRALDYLKRQEAQGRYIDRTINSEFVSLEESKLLNLLENELRDVEMLVITPKHFVSRVDVPTKTELQEYYDENSAIFNRPAEIDANLIVIEADQVFPKDKLDDAIVSARAKSILDSQAAASAHTENKVSILAIDPEITENFQDVLEQLTLSLTKESFHAKVVEFSTDISADSEGKLDWVAAQDLPEEFQQALASTEVGSVSSSTEYEGATYFLLNEQERSNTPDLADIEEQVRVALHTEMIQQEYPKFISQLEDYVYDKVSLEDIANKTNLSITDVNEPLTNVDTSDLSKFGIQDQVVDVISRGNYTEQVFGPWQNTQGQIIVARINEISQISQIPFSEVSAAIQNELMVEKTQIRYQDAVAQVQEQLYADKNLSDIAEELDLSVALRTAEDIKLTNTILPISLTKDIFTFDESSANSWIEFEESDDTKFFVKIINTKISNPTDIESTGDEPTKNLAQRSRALIAIESIIKLNFDTDDIEISDRSAIPEDI